MQFLFITNRLVIVKIPLTTFPSTHIQGRDTIRRWNVANDRSKSESGVLNRKVDRKKKGEKEEIIAERVIGLFDFFANCFFVFLGEQTIQKVECSVFVGHGYWFYSSYSLVVFFPFFPVLIYKHFIIL